MMELVASSSNAMGWEVEDKATRLLHSIHNDTIEAVEIYGKVFLASISIDKRYLTDAHFAKRR